MLIRFFKEKILRTHKKHFNWIVSFILAVSICVSQNNNLRAEETNPDYNLAKMEAFSWVLLQLKQDYVDPGRVQPEAMMSRALEYVELRVSEVEIKLKDGKAQIQVGAQIKEFVVGKPSTVWEMNYNLQPIFEFISEHLEPTTDPKDVEFAAINGMLSTLDPHSNLLPPELFRAMQLKTTGEFGGLGIRITIRKGALTIISPLPDTPAARMGLKAMDQIVRIGDHSTVNMPLDEAVNLLQGPKGTKVTIWVKRVGWSEPHKYVITRDTIRVRSIVSKLLDNQIGYINIQEFGRHTGGDLLRYLTEMKREAKGLKGLILDLRNNAGGLMKAAVMGADLFLDRGIIVATVAYDDDSTPENKIQKSREEKRAREEGAEIDLPIVVLVNSGSASASEILAGAIKNLDRAILMGERTFGKGTVQILNERVPRAINDACLKLTVAEYLIPGDISIQEVGVTPDIQLVPVILDKENIQAFAQRNHFREEDIPVHLKKHSAAKLKPSEVIRYVIKADDSKEDDEEAPLEEPEFEEDYEIKLAKRFILATKATKGSLQLDKGQAFLKEERNSQQEEMAKQMKAFKVDWSSGNSSGAQGTATFKLQGKGVDKKGNALADKNINMILQVKNTGSSPFYRLRAESECKHNLYDKREFLFGEVKPGKTGTWQVPIKIPRGALSRTDDIRFKFFCEGGEPPAPLETTISTKELPRPAFGFSWQILDPKGNGDGLVQPGEEVSLLLSVHNQGEGKSFAAKALLKNEAGKDLFLQMGKGRVELSEILPDGIKSEAFQFHVRKDTTRTELPVELTIWDADLGASQIAKFSIPVQRKSLGTVKRIKTGLKVKHPRTEIRGGASAKSSLVAYAKKGAVLKADRQIGEWYRVLQRKKINAKNGKAKFSNEPLGWIQAGNIQRVSSKKAALKINNVVVFNTQLTPPKVTLKKVPAYLKNGATVKVSGQVEDADASLRDVSVWVNDEEVFLTSGANGNDPHLIKFDVDVDLEPGPNFLTVIAREGAKYSTQKTVLVTRPGGLDYKKDKSLNNDSLVLK
jgi:carboxyl-terminal processing protease